MTSPSPRMAQVFASFAPLDRSAAGSSRILYLDGWRAVAILLVIASHFAILYDFTFPYGRLGVLIFFALSGYIITRFLVLEQRETGGIDLRAFYLRRSARILPPLLLYTLVVILIFRSESVLLEGLRGLTLTCNVAVLTQWTCGWLFGHVWSLSYEEQFYLIYPFLLLGLVRWWIVPLGLLFLAPFLMPVHFVGRIGYVQIIMLLMLGGAIAAYEQPLRARLARVGYSLHLLCYLALFIILAWPWMQTPTMTQKALALLLPFAITLVIFELPNRLRPLHAILTTGGMTTLGLYSYSLYLWQQLFTMQADWNAGGIPVLGVLAALGISVLSYHTIEMHFRRAARRWTQAQDPPNPQES